MKPWVPDSEWDPDVFDPTDAVCSAEGCEMPLHLDCTAYEVPIGVADANGGAPVLVVSPLCGACYLAYMGSLDRDLAFALKE